MLIQEYISKDFPAFEIDAPVEEALLQVEEFGFTHIFVKKKNVFLGGICKEFLEENPEYVDSMFYRGQHTRTPYWNNKRIAGVRNTKEVDEQGVYNRMIVP